MPTIDTQRLRRPAACLCVALLLGLLASPAAWSADKDNAGQVRALQQRLRAAEQDKAHLAAERVELDGQAKEAADKLAQSRRSADAVSRQRQALVKELGVMTAEKSALAEQIAKAGSELTELKAQLLATQGGLERSQGQLGSTQDQLGRTESQRAQLDLSLAERTQVLTECTARNDELTQTAAGLLAELGAPGLGRPLEGEPLTQLARVAVENKLEAYRERIDRAQFAPAAQQRLEATQRQTNQQRQAEASELRTQVEQARTARQQVAGEKARQQSDLDRLTRRVREYFEGIEW